MQSSWIVKWCTLVARHGTLFWGLFLMAVGAGTAILSPYLLFGAAAVFFALWFIPRAVLRKYGITENSTYVAPDRRHDVAAPTKAQPMSNDANDTELLGVYRNDLAWMANRSVVKWMDAISGIANPIEYDSIAEREARLYSALISLGIKMPRYGDGRWRIFWRRLYSIANRGDDIAEARMLLDDLTAELERRR